VAASNINRVIITGNLTADPELRAIGSSGNSVCKLRVAVNTRRKDGQSGEWVDKPNYFDVTVWGAQGENCARYLSKGRGVAVDGRLEWREWQDKESGKNRQSIDIIADSVQFLSSPEGAGGGNGGNGFSARTDVPVNTDDFAAAPVGGGGGGAPSAADDDIPF
jgi:single-strand DNA-binding protein